MNTSLIKQAILARQANRRQGTTHTKTRGEVSGGGRKPWRQKGTGRARAGSNRSPIWAGGGITFGPDKNRNFSHRLPKKMNRKAITELLAFRKSEKALSVVPSLSLKEAKTKQLISLLKDNQVFQIKVTLVSDAVEAELVLAARNLQGVTVVTSENLSVLNLIGGHILIDQKAAAKFGLITAAPKKVTSKTNKGNKQ